MYTIRPARKDDLSDVIRLWNLCLPYDHADSEHLESFFGDPNYYEPDAVLVAESDAALVGLIIAIGNQGDTGWIPVFFVHPNHVGSDIGDRLLSQIQGFFRARGVRYAKVEPFHHPARFFSGIDSRYTGILHMFTRNGFEQTEDSQVDIVKNLLGFTMPPWATRAAESLHQQGITFDFCEPAFRQKYLQFMTEHLPGFSGWCEAAKDYVENEGDPRLRILAFHASTVVGFTAYSKDYDWYIWATGVRRDFRRKKIGSVLVFLALEEMKRRGASRMCISDCPYDFYKVVEGEVVRRYIWMAKALK